MYEDLAEILPSACPEFLEAMEEGLWTALEQSLKVSIEDYYEGMDRFPTNSDEWIGTKGHYSFTQVTLHLWGARKILKPSWYSPGSSEPVPVQVPPPADTLFFWSDMDAVDLRAYLPKS